MKNLSKEEMKKVIGGEIDAGNRCVLYCCPTGGGDCIFEASYDRPCLNNDECQDWAVGHGADCSSGYYVGALCKS